MAADTLQDLQAEFAAEGLGPLLRARVRRVAARTASRYPPGVYARTGRWDDKALDDVVQDVFVELLDGHLATIFDYVRALAGLDKSIRETTRDVLADRRQRTVIDNLLDRVREMGVTPPFAIDGAGASLRIRLQEMAPEEQAISDAEVRAAAQRIIVIPRIPARTVERAPRIYGPEALKSVLLGVLQAVGRPVGLTDLRRILEAALTDLAVSELQYIDDESAHDDRGDPQRSLAQRDQAAEAAPGMAEPMVDPATASLASNLGDTMIDSLSPEQRTVVRLKFARASDTEIAQALDVSRPTAAKRREETLGILAAHLADLDEKEVTAAVKHMLCRLAESP